MRSLLVLALAWVLLVPVPALAQPSQDGPSGAQYDQYGGPPDSGVGGQAVQDAVVASGAIRDSAEKAQGADEEAASAAEAQADEEAASATEAQDESAPALEVLPDTGGPSPWWLGVPILCVGGLLARRMPLWRLP